MAGPGLHGPHVPPKLCHPMICELVWIPRQAQLGKLEVRGLQARVCHFQLGSYTSVPASPCPAPPCPEVLGHLSLDTSGGAILRHSGPFRTHFYLPLASPSPGLPGPPSFPMYTSCFRPLCLYQTRFSVPQPPVYILQGPPKLPPAEL